MWTERDISEISISNVSDVELDVIRSLLAQWNAKYDRNLTRNLYYDAEQAFKDLGIALPRQLRNSKFILGWATQAVKKPAMRTQFQGLRLTGSDDPLELNGLLNRNRFPLVFGQSVVSANKHGASLITVAGGAPGEAKVLVHPHSLDAASAFWDSRRRWVSAGMTLNRIGEEDNPLKFTVWLDNVVLVCEKRGGGWVADRIPNPTGRPQMVAIPHDPQIGQPFGRSRLTNPVMGLTDMAARTYVRMEGNAEFYSSPQIALLGVAEDLFDGEMPESRKFKLAQDRLIALTKDEDGDMPSLTQLQQASMLPHSDMLRTIAMAFTGETGIPPSSLGIIHDNPSSAEAIRANEHDMLVDVLYHNEYVYSPAVADIAVLMYLVREGTSEVPEEAWGISGRFADPEFRSSASQADAAFKMATGMEKMAQWDVLLESMFDDREIESIKDNARRNRGRAMLDDLRAQFGPAGNDSPSVDLPGDSPSGDSDAE